MKEIILAAFRVLEEKILNIQPRYIEWYSEWFSIRKSQCLPTRTRSLSRSARADSYVSVVSLTTSGGQKFYVRNGFRHLTLGACHFRPGRNVKPECWVACGRKLRVGAATGCNLMHDVLKYPLARKGGETFDRIPVLRETISCANHTTTRAPIH